MDLELFSLTSFVIITTFSPGPNNISSASMGILYGYKKTVHFLLGIASGFFIVMICCAYLSSTLLALVPESARYLRIIGALYIIWLAAGTLRSNVGFGDIEQPQKAFTKGFALQLFNPKVAVYGMTLFSTFLHPVAGHPHTLAAFSLGFSLTAFIATSTWALCGAAIKSKLKNKTFRRRINLVLFFALIYAAIDLSGIIT